jgi:hypothetical protein
VIVRNRLLRRTTTSLLVLALMDCAYRLGRLVGLETGRHAYTIHTGRESPVGHQIIPRSLGRMKGL